MIWSRKRVYVDAAASTPLSPKVIRELERLLPLFGNPSALHKEALQAKKELDSAKQKIATAIGAHQDEIIGTSGGTESNNLAIKGVLQSCIEKKIKVHAITSVIEHASVLEPLRQYKRLGIECTELPVNSAGLVSLEALSATLLPHTQLISIQFVNSEIGTIQPIQAIAKEIRHIRSKRKSEGNDTPLYFHVDASQAPLWKTVQVEKLGVDLLTLDGQKILGPKGVGVLYVRRGVKLSPDLLGGGQERGMRSGTENVPLLGAFAAALEEAQAAENKNAHDVAALRNYLLQKILKVLPSVLVNGAVGDMRVANNLNISIPGLDGEMCVIALDALGIAASTRSACDASDEEPSHVLTAIGLSPAVIKNAIRITLLPNATKKDAQVIAKALLEVKNRYGTAIARS